MIIRGRHRSSTELGTSSTPEVKTVNGVATLGEGKGAWFKDSEGNMLALGQFD